MQVEVSDELVEMIDEYHKAIGNKWMTLVVLQEKRRRIADRMTIALSCARSMNKKIAEFEDKVKEAEERGEYLEYLFSGKRGEE
jgi:DNA-directed RNA polymerase subunit N (RpoN/RPB10)